MDAFKSRQRQELREQQLGFKPQSEIVHNINLPYDHCYIDNESNVALSLIKTNLAKAILSLDIYEGVSFWTNQLTKYIKLYGFKFSKEDHILFVKLLFEIIIMPELDSALVSQMCDSLRNLLKKRHLLSCSDLQLEWIPLYKLYERLVYSKKQIKGLEKIPLLIKEKLEDLIVTCNCYFIPKCTQSMLDEWRPCLCPFSWPMQKAVKYFNIFLPMLAFDDVDRNVSWKLWADEFLLLWTSVKDVSCDKDFVNLFARLAFFNIGHIDWLNYVNPLFAKLHSALNFHFNDLQKNLTNQNKVSFKMLSVWIVSMMGGDLTKIILQNLNCLLKGAETYFHPYNSGDWTDNLFSFVEEITFFFVDRVFRERYERNDWKPIIPKSFLLDDKDIEEFVEILKPVVLLTLYNEATAGVTTITKVLKHLTHLRPDLILPELLDKSYIALNAPTEPHQVTGCLAALTFAISAGISGYFDTKKHIVPLLFQCLPALDLNDLSKSTLAFKFITMCIVRIPLVDCSSMAQHHTHLSESEKEIFHMTAQFEAFALQVFDRCFVLLEIFNQGNESPYHESTSPVASPLTSLEITFWNDLINTCCAILHQSSKSIYEACLKKVFLFSSTHLLKENTVMGVVSRIVSTAVHIHPAEGLALFIPHYCNVVKEYFVENTEAKNLETVDEQLVWDLTILSVLCSDATEHLLQYKLMLFEVAENGIEMLAKEAYKPAVALVGNCIQGWSSYFSTDRKCWNGVDSMHSFSISDWGSTMSPWNIAIEWHIPSEDEYEACFGALNQFLEPAVQKLHDFNNNHIDLTKEELKKVLTVIKVLLKQCYMFSYSKHSNLIPPCENTSGIFFKSWPICTVEALPFYDSVMSKNTRKQVHTKVFNVLHASLKNILQIREDDADAICLIVEIYKQSFFKSRQLKVELDEYWKCFDCERLKMRDVFAMNKKSSRIVHVGRVEFQEQMRVAESFSFPLMHDKIMLDLLDLSMSHYSKVRLNAQECFFQGMELDHDAAYQKYLPHILRHLDPQDEINPQAYEGALDVLIGITESTLFSKGNQKWNAISAIWLSLVNAPSLNKQSIKDLFDLLTLKLYNNFVTVSVQSKITEGAMQSAINLMASNSLPSIEKFDTKATIEKGKKFNDYLNHSNLNNYKQLVDSLIAIYNSGKLTWMRSELAVEMLSLLLRSDIPASSALSTLFVSLLVDDSVKIRHLAISSFVAILQQQKREHVVEMLSMDDAVTTVEQMTGLNVCDPTDNAWLLYDEDNLPNTEEKYNAMKFVDKTFWGYYCWPKQLKTYASFDQQPKLDRNREGLPSGEVFAFDQFTNTEFLEQVVNFLCMEVNKSVSEGPFFCVGIEKNKFDYKKSDMFKGLFRNYGDTFLPFFKPHILRLVTEKQASHQRCAAEIIVGIVNGSRHWPYAKVSKLWDWLIPVLQTVLCHIGHETENDWLTAFEEMTHNRDPRQIHWLLNFLVNAPTHISNSLLVQTSKLKVLHSSIRRQRWKVPQLLDKTLKLVEPLLDCSFDELRITIGQVLSTVFKFDIPVVGKLSTVERIPSINEFIQRVVTRIMHFDELAVSNAVDQVNIAGLSLEQSHDCVHSSTKFDETQADHQLARTKAKTRIFKSVIQWMVYFHFDFQQFKISFFSLLPLIGEMYPVHDSTSDKELGIHVSLGISAIAGHVIEIKEIKNALDVIKVIVVDSSWQTKFAALSYIQIFGFTNLFSIRSNEDATTALQEIIVDLLQDQQYTVSQMACSTLSGLVQCRAIPVTENLTQLAHNLCSTKLKKRGNSNLDDEDMAKRMLKRHAGILITSACVSSAPYTIPDWMPELVLLLANHVHDPQPIRRTVKSSLDEFRRTHRDNWMEDKKKFTTDQLDVLNGVLTSPSYYA